jgi:predicted metal-dependent phosphoesterase TrpH
MIDLHAHTTASDGSRTPTQLVQLAKETGLTALGITDHDTIDGLAEGETAAEAAGVRFVPGVELSVDYKPGQFHLLGYFIDYRSRPFLDRLTYLQDNRVNRNTLMIERMQAAGLPMTMEDLLEAAGGGQVGRPHMALAMVRKGIVSSVQEAFDRYLADGKPCHIPKVKLGPEDAIELVHLAGGAAILAHPKYLRQPDEGSLSTELERLRECELDGIEVYYSQHSPEETAAYLRIAHRLHFAIGAGSDFHGDSKPHVALGRIYQGRAAEDSLLEAIATAASRRSGCAPPRDAKTPAAG